jgi:DNA-directed RNA polymerase sigma subunit (sigma70/sigma32)
MKETLHDVGVKMIRRFPDRFASKLTDGERQLLRWRLGIGGTTVRTLRDLAKEFRVSIDTVRQREYAAIRKLMSKR